jgi:tRNA nucleotidyltransferase (CCA-adding enzyme)
MRRDFTVNSIYRKTSEFGLEEYLDPLSGQKDLSEGLLRVNYDCSFKDDPTRMIRLFSFVARYGFQPDERTNKQIDPNYMDKVSMLLLVKEFIRILSSEHCHEILDLVVSHNLLNRIGLTSPEKCPSIGTVNKKLLVLLQENSELIKVFEQLGIYSKLIRKV